jgi:hypothetical protein
MLSSTNPSKRFFGTFGPAAGVVATCLSLASLAHAQDECATATPAVLGANAFNTTTASASVDPPTDALCPGTELAWTATVKDVWFSYTPGMVGSLSMTTCGVATDLDSSIAVYEGSSCGTMTIIACNGDDPAADPGCQPYYSTINGILTDATSTYYIRVAGWNGLEGSGTLTLSFTNVVYPQCVGSTDECGEVHAAGGCSDTACCELVCGTYPPCCDTTWEQLCVDLAVDSCGIFAYNCTAPAYANDCATAAMVVADGASVAFNTAGANTDGPNEAGCNSGNNDLPIWSDLWYRFTAVANGFASASNCNTSAFDSKIAFYDVGDWSGFDPQTLPDLFMACNEDCPEDPVNYTSAQTVQVTIGRTYLVRLGGYEGATGSGTINFDFPDPCSLPGSDATEPEPCGDDVNPGCIGGNTIATTSLPIGATMAGTFWADANFRDVDWYQIVINSPSQVTVEVWSASNTILFLFGGDPCMANPPQLASGTATACPQSLSVCLNPGVYYIATAISSFDGTPCGSGAFNDYRIKVSTAPANCPILLGTVCENPGPTDLTTNAANTTANGLGSCAYGYPPGGTGDNSWARVYPAAQVGAGELRCITFGVWCTKQTGATTYVASDVPHPAVLTLYRDTNGGAPVNPVSLGGDLEIVQEWNIVVPGGAFAGTISLDTPLCLDGNSQNLVVAIYCPAPLPLATGYNLRASGNNVVNSPATQTYRKLACVDTTFILSTSAFNWYVSINGDFTSCGNNCPADLNNDDIVDGADLGTLLGSWGSCPGCPADLNDDDVVDGADLGTLLGEWGPC